MRVIRFAASAPVALAVTTLLAACGGSPQPSGGGAAADAQTPPQADVVKHMHDHLAQVEAVQQAVVRGDLDDARAAAKQFAEHQVLEGMPSTVKPAIADMLQAAQTVSTAGDLKAAGEGTGAMVTACGSCHRAMSASPGFPAPPEPAKAASPTTARMLEHQQAVEMLYHGLIAPSEELWAKGAQALKASPLKADAFPLDANLAREALDAQSRAHEAAEKAAEAKAPWQRAHIYGELIGECASCHALSGRVLGAGVPKK